MKADRETVNANPMKQGNHGIEAVILGVTPSRIDCDSIAVRKVNCQMPRTGLSDRDDDASRPSDTVRDKKQKFVFGHDCNIVG